MFFMFKLLFAIVLPTVTLFVGQKFFGTMGTIQVLLVQILFYLIMNN